MNRKNIFLLLFLMVLCMTSCKSKFDEGNNTPRNKHFHTTCNDHDGYYNFGDLYLTIEELPNYVNDYINNHQELFGTDVLVFNTWQELDNEIEALQHMSYSELRYWLNARGHNNAILSSLIIHDSVQSVVWQDFGIDFDSTTMSQSITENIIDESVEDLAFEQYDKIMNSEFAEYVKEDVNQAGAVILSPLGSLDEQVFCNNKNLFICEGIVVKYLSDGILSCPINEYDPTIASAQMVSEIDLPNNTTRRILVSPYAPNDYNFSSNSIDPKYLTKVNYHISVTGAWFGLERKKTSVCVSNYHRNSDGSYRSVACWTTLHTDMGVTCHADSWDYHIETSWWMSGRKTYWRVEYIDCGCTFSRFTYITLHTINQHGLEINDHL